MITVSDNKIAAAIIFAALAISMCALVLLATSEQPEPVCEVTVSAATNDLRWLKVSGCQLKVVYADDWRGK